MNIIYHPFYILYCYNKLKKNEEAKNANIALAEYYVNFAEQTVQRDMLGAMRAGNFFHPQFFDSSMRSGAYAIPIVLYPLLGYGYLTAAVRVSFALVHLYRNSGEKEKAENTHRRLVEVQKDIPKLMVPITMELDITMKSSDLKHLETQTHHTFSVRQTIPSTLMRRIHLL